MDPTGNTNIPNGAKRVVAVTGGYQIQSYNGTTWVSVGKLIHDCDSVDGKSPNIGTAAGTIPVRDNKGQLPGDITGNSATTTKLATARTIDLGGIVSATEQSFDGSKPITIPVNSVNINNDNDDAVVGVLTPKHGGTGRTDGAAADVVVSSAQGDVKASDYGQIGDAKNINGTDLDTLTVSGNYVSTNGTIALHYPYGNASIWKLDVQRCGTSIRQVLFSPDAVWTRYSSNTGSSWTQWLPIGKRESTLTLYISKSGSDTNTGTSSDAPVQTLNRALRIAHGWTPSAQNKSVRLCFGEGNWGNVYFKDVPFLVCVYPYDNTAATSYSSSLPVFTNIDIRNCKVELWGVVSSVVTIRDTGFLCVTGYLRFAQLNCGQFSCVNFDSSAHHDIISMDKHTSVLRAYTASYFLVNQNTYFNIAENLNLTQGFLWCFRAAGVMLNFQPFTMAEGVTVTGKKYQLDGCDTILSTKTSLDSLPGSLAGAINNGTTIGDGVWGGGDEHYLMGGDATWRRDSSYIYARDVAVNGDTSDLASARGQIGNNYRLPDDVDLNDITTPGVYGVRGATATNVPGSSWYALWVMNGYGSTCSQLAVAVSVANPHMYLRSWDGSSWCPWTEINTNESPYAIFTGATASAAGAKGLVPAPAKGQTGSYFLNGAGNFMQVPYLRYTVPKGGYVDAVEYMVPEKTNRIACIRVGNEMDTSSEGYYTLLLGVNDGDNAAPQGITIFRDIETGAVHTNVSGDFTITGDLTVNGSISGQNAFSTGDFVWSYASSKSGFLLCNGAAISRTTYADLYAVIGTKFGTGNGSTTFNLPDMRGKVAQGANGNLGTVLAAGLPNITGNVTLYTQVISAGGAFAQGSGGNRADGNYGADHVRFDFNASRSSSIYGNSSTVQPPAITLNCFIKY